MRLVSPQSMGTLPEESVASNKRVERGNRFVQGYFCAVACIVKGHGASTETEEAIRAMGTPSITQLRKDGVDDYDIQILKPVIMEMRRQRRRINTATTNPNEEEPT